MSIIIHFSATSFIPTPVRLSTTSSCASRSRIKVAMVPGIDETDQTVMTDDESSMVDIATSNTLYTHTVNDLKSSSHVLGSCFGLPYQDHNYGAPPPPTPPSYSPCASPAHANGVPDEDTNLSIVSTSTTNEETHGSSITRCICGFEHDDEYMICCDLCLVWQHVDCMGLDRNNIPDTYLCEKCEPRKVDRHKAKALQARKKVAMTDSSDSEEDLSAKNSDRKQKNRKRKRKEYDKINEKLEHTHGKRSKRVHKNSKEKIEAKRTKLRRTKNKESTSTADEEAQDAWEISLEWCEKNFETASSNQYTSEVQHLTKTVPLQGHEEKLAELLLTQNCKVIDGNQKKLISIYDIPRDQPLTEYKGKFLLASQFYDLHPAFSKRLFPFVLFYTIMDVDICVDASLYGNEARYIRRSCKPNAEVRHLVYNGSLHLYISSTKAVFKDDEITLPLDITAVKESIKDLECACESDDCLLKLYLKNGGTDVSQEKKRKGRKVIFSADEDSSQSFLGNNISAKSKCLSKSNSQTSETTEGKSDFETEEQANERKKKTREERKIDAIMRAFDQMEKAAKRRQQALERQKANNPKSDDVSEKTDNVNETKDDEKVVTASGSETQCGEDEKLHSQTSKPKKGKRRRSSGTPARRRSRTNSGGSDILSPEESTHQKEIPTPVVPVADIVPKSDPVVETSCASTDIPSTLVTTSSTLSPVSPSVQASSVLKTKRFLLQEWLQEKSETNTNPSTTSSMSVCTDVKWNTSATSSTCYVQCTKDNPHSGGISAAHLRPSSSSSQIKSLPLKSPTEQGFTKKRWLRQAMFDCNSYDEPLTIDPGGLEGLSFDNGYLSPTIHGEMGSPGAVDDTVTPLKKRRLMRESVDSVSSPLSPTVLNSDISISSEMNSENNQSKSSTVLLESAQKSPSAKMDPVDLPASSKENTLKKINGLRLDLLKIPKKLNIKQEASDCESTNASDVHLPDNQVSITNLNTTLSSNCKAVESSMQNICDLGGETNVCIKNDYLVDSVNVTSSDCQNNCDSGLSADSAVSSCIDEKPQSKCETESADNSFKVSFGSTDKCNKTKKENTSIDDQNPRCSASESNSTYFLKSVSSETKDDTQSLLETQKTTLETAVESLSPKDNKCFADDMPSNFSGSSSSLSVTSKDIKEKSSDLISECSELHPPVFSINDLDVSSINNPDVSSINNSDGSSINNSDGSSNLLSNHKNDTIKKDESRTLLTDSNFANSEIQNNSSLSSNVSVSHIKPSESTDLDSKTSESLKNCSSSPKITCASATQKRKVSLSEYRLRMKDSPNKQMNSEQTKKSSIVTAIPESLPELVTLAPLPLFDTSIGPKSPLQTSPKILNKKKEAVKNDDEFLYSDISEHRENLTERLKREFGFDDDLEDCSSTLSHLKSECGNVSTLSFSVNPPPPPPPPPPRPVRPSHTTGKLAAEAAPSQFGFNVTAAYARPSFIVPQVPSAQYIPVQQTINTPVISSGHPVAAPVAQCSVQPTLLPSPHSFAPSLSGTVLQPSLQHEFPSVNAQNYSTLIQQTPPPPPKSYSHMYKSTLFK